MGDAKSGRIVRTLTACVVLALVVVGIVLAVWSRTQFTAGKGDMANYWQRDEFKAMGAEATKILQSARREAGDERPVSTGHILISLMRNRGAFEELLNRHGIDPRRMYVEVHNSKIEEPESKLSVAVTQPAHDAIQQALAEATRQNANAVSAQHLVWGLLQTNGIAYQVLGSHNISADTLRETER
jgi:ATP-dependent Clp protease ATP-binding subunit ClpA